MKMWHIYTMDTTQPKKSEIRPSAATCMDPEMVSEAGQKEKDKYHVTSLARGIYSLTQRCLRNKSRVTDIENRAVATQGEGKVRSLGSAGASYLI